jgi:tryptophanyl-tRNA synthetase
MIAIVKQVMANSDAHQEKMDANMKTTELEPTMEQKTEFLKAVKEILTEMRDERKTFRDKMKAMYIKMMAKLDAHHERATACQETTVACLECKEPTLGDMESEAEYR